MSNPSPSATAEAIKAKEREAAPNNPLGNLERQANKLESDPRFTRAKLIREMRGDKSPQYQAENLTAWSVATVNILRKLAENAVNIQQDWDAKKLQREVTKNGITLDLDEAALLENLDRVLKEGGETALQINQGWPDYVTTAQQTAKGLAGKAGDFVKDVGARFKNAWEEDRVGTITLAVAVLGGIWLGYQGYKAIRSKDDKGNSWFSKKIMAGVLLTAACVWFGKDALVKIFGKKEFAAMEDRIKKNLPLTPEQQAQVKAADPAVQKQVAAMQKQVQAAAAPKGAASSTAAVASTTESGGDTKMPNGTETVAEKAGELADAARYTASKKAFLAFYFNPRYINTAVFNETVDHLSQTDFQKILASVNEHKDDKKIPKSEFPTVKSDINEEHLFSLLERMVSYSKLGPSVDGKMTVQQMFENVWKNPLADQLDDLHSAVTGALKDGNIGDAIKALAVEGTDHYRLQAPKMSERLDGALGIDCSTLTFQEKTAYREIQVLLLANPILIKRDPDEVIGNLLLTNGHFRTYPRAVELAKTFFSKVKEKAPVTLEMALSKFEIKKEGLPNYLREGVNMDKLRFNNACELVLLEKALQGNGDEASNLLILGVLIKSFTEPRLKEPYIGLISDEMTKNVPSINIPGLKFLKPYLEKTAGMAGAHIGYKLLDFMQRWSPYQTQHPTAKSHKEMAEAFKNQNIIFGAPKEAAGTALELTTDAMAAIVLSLGLEDNLASCESGKEFLDLIRVHGGHITAYKDRDGVMGILIDTGYEVFLARPGAILWESTKALAAGELGDAAAIWAGGSSFFVGAGAIQGLFKTARAPEGGGRVIYSIRTRTVNAFLGGLRGLKYPIKAPLMAMEGSAQFIKGLATGTEAISSMAKAPLREGSRVLNWSSDVLRYGIPGQNIENMVDTGRLLEKHFELANITGDVPQETGIGAGVKRAVRSAEELIKSPRNALRQMTAGDWHWGMTKKFAERYGKQYNDLFGFDQNTGFKLSDLNTHGKVKELIHAKERLTGFLEKVQQDSQLLGKIRDAASKFKGESLKGELVRMLEGAKLSNEEAKALASRISSEKMAQKVTEQIERAAARHAASKTSTPGRISEGLSRLGSKVKDRFGKKAPDAPDATKPADVADAVKSTGKTEAALAKAEGDLVAVQKRLAEAEQEVTRLGAVQKQALKAGEAKEVERQLTEARDIVTKGRTAETELEKTVNAIRKMKDAEEALAKAGGVEAVARLEGELQAASKTADDVVAKMKAFSDAKKSPPTELLDKYAQARQTVRKAEEGLASLGKAQGEFKAATQAAEQASVDASKALEEVGKISKWGLRLRGLGAVAGAAGAIYGFYEAGGAAHEALTTDVEGRASVKGTEAAVRATVATADAAFATTEAAKVLAGRSGLVAARLGSVMAGRSGLVLSRLSGAAVPLIPLTFAATTVLESKYEETKTDYEWIQGDPVQVLNHFYTSIHACSLGDGWRASINTDKGVAENVDAKKETMRRIFRGLVAIQKDPKLLEDISKTPSSKEKDQAIKQRIDDNYSVYHEYYFRSINVSQLNNFESARRFVQDAQLFDTIMTDRDKAKAAGKEFVVAGKDKAHPFSLHLDRYDVLGGVENPKGRTDFIPSQVVAAYKESSIEKLETEPTLKSGLDQVSTDNLVGLYVQCRLFLQRMKGIEKPVSFRAPMKKTIAVLEPYLKFSRGIDLELAARQPEYHQHQTDESVLREQLTDLFSGGNKHAQLEKTNETTPASHSLYKLGEYFGYVGSKTETGLKNFFSEATAGQHGIFWDGNEWKLHERGFAFNDSLGKELSEGTLRAAIETMKKDPDNILQHRNDSVFLDSYDYTDEVLCMAKILEDGLKEGKDRGYQEKNGAQQKVPEAVAKAS